MCSHDSETDVIGSCNEVSKKLSQLNISQRKLRKSVAKVKSASGNVSSNLWPGLSESKWEPAAEICVKPFFFYQCGCVATARCVIHHWRLVHPGQLLHPWYFFQIKLFKHTVEKPASSFSLCSRVSKKLHNKILGELRIMLLHLYFV